MITIAFDKYNYTITSEVDNSPLGASYYKTFERKDMGFFLVTRLDAYTVEQVKSLID